MVDALVGDSTTTTSMLQRLPAAPEGGATPAGRESETRLPGCRSRRPANSSSSKMVATIGAVNRLCRTRRSTGTGLEPSSAVTASRASPGASSSSGASAAAPRGHSRRGSSSTRPRPSASASSNVVRALDQGSPLANQAVGPARARVQRRAGDRHHLASLLQREPRRDQRAGARRALDHHHAAGQPCDDAVCGAGSACRWARCRGGPRRSPSPRPRVARRGRGSPSGRARPRRRP